MLVKIGSTLLTCNLSLHSDLSIFLQSSYASKQESQAVSVQPNIKVVQKETPVLNEIDQSSTEFSDPVTETDVQPLPVPDSVNPAMIF